MSLPAEKRAELLRLYDAFVASYLESPEGHAHLAACARSEKEGRSNFRAIVDAADRDEDVTDRVLLKLLPHVNTLENVRRGAWIHATRTVQGDVRRWFEKKGWIRKRDWPRVAAEILGFVRKCVDDPRNLERHCEEFAAIPYIKGFQSPFLSPILNALRPERFSLITGRSASVLGGLLGRRVSTHLRNYPSANRATLDLFDEIGDELVDRAGLGRVPPHRLFDLFCWWEGIGNVAERKEMDIDGKGLPVVGESRAEYRPEEGTRRRAPASPEAPLTLESCAARLHVPPDRLRLWLDALGAKGQAIFYGPPGTGKTYAAETLARYVTSGTEGFHEIVQFHPSYSYEDFVEGIRPRRGRNGELDYPVVEGRFLVFCEEARRRAPAPCVMIVDEINRANLSRVFGELMYLLEYREREARLAVDGRSFSIPGNVLLIGTMNTADRSIALVDYALRRRFAFIELEPDYDVLRDFFASAEGSAEGVDLDELIRLLTAINTAVDERHYRLGVSFFLVEDLLPRLRTIWTTEIEPYLEEYFFDDPAKVDDFRWDRIGERLVQ